MNQIIGRATPRLIIMVILLFLIVAGVLYISSSKETFWLTQPFSKPTPATGSVSAGGGTITPAKTVHILGPTDQKYINQAITYLRKKLSPEYYQKYITLSVSSSTSSQICDANNQCQVYNVVNFTQSVSSDHYFETTGPVARDILMSVSVTMDDSGKVTNYNGPKKPYAFNLSKSDVLIRSQALGINNASQAGLTGVNQSADGYDIVWKVENDSAGVMLDPDTGALTGRYTPYHCKVNCPICLASNTSISTPLGETNVKELKVGMPVYSVDKAGQKIVSRIAKVSDTKVKNTHQVIHLNLTDGRELWVSPKHPIVNGLEIKDLKVGDMYDGSKLKDIALVQYWDNKTYDLLPDSGTGFYWANGILVASTLK